MIFARRPHKVPGLNTTSTADISFMLLIFFLVTTSMDVDKGLTRQLPPAEKEEQQQTDISRQTLMSISVLPSNRLTIDGKPAAIKDVRKMVLTFVRQRGKRHLISIDCDPQAEYDTYFNLQNEIVGAYRQLRNEYSASRFHRPYDSLTQQQKAEVREACPQRIAETYNGSHPRHQEEGGEK